MPASKGARRVLENRSTFKYASIYIFACQYKKPGDFRYLAQMQNLGMRSLRWVCNILRLHLSLPISWQYLQLIYLHRSKSLFYNSNAPTVHSSSQHDSLDPVEMRRYPKPPSLQQSRLGDYGGSPPPKYLKIPGNIAVVRKRPNNLTVGPIHVPTPKQV